ncbi:MAG TPA: hypothetical protein VG820_12805 [Fimbriimonadaceae bacterium]|nr:hypothetical protein [Fimbriimonadaceae bacterium]
MAISEHFELNDEAFGVRLITVSPLCQVEIEQLAAVEIKGDLDVPPLHDGSRYPVVHTLDIHGDHNPKLTGCHSRRS